VTTPTPQTSEPGSPFEEGALRKFHELFAQMESGEAEPLGGPPPDRSRGFPGTAPAFVEEVPSASSVGSSLDSPLAAMIDVPALPPPAASPSPALQRKPRAPPSVHTFEPTTQSWAMVGPTGAGKTCLLAAFDAACFADAKHEEGIEGSLAISWHREGGRVDALQHAAHRWIALGEGAPSTHEVSSYSFELAVGRPRRWLVGSAPMVRQLRCYEAPGSLLFPDDPKGEAPDELVRRQIAELTTASALILVVDATRPCASAIESSLPGLLDRVASSRPAEVPHLARFARSADRSSRRRKRLAARRLLVLLNKVDVLAEHYVRLADRNAGAGEILSAVDAASALDPLPLAMEVIGARCIRRLHRALSRDAELAIGVTSASGFSPDGAEPLAQWSRGRTEDERMRAWAPFGVREALRFLSTGRLGPSLHRVTEDDLGTEDPIPLKPSFLSGGTR
jgi:hypothetical protein